MREEVEFKNKKGEVLKGFLHTSDGDAHRAGVVFAHCFTCSRSVKIYRLLAEKLAEHFCVLRFDFAGNGSSGGVFEDSNFSKQMDDLSCAIKFLKKRVNGKIGLLGHSMGAAVAILESARNRDVSAVVTMGADSSTAGIEHVFSKSQLDCMLKTGECEFVVFGKKVKMRESFLDDARSFSISSTLKKSSKPICIIHGDKDEILHVSNARKLYFFANDPKDLELVRGENHMFTKRPAVSVELAREWFEKFLI